MNRVLLDLGISLKDITGVPSSKYKFLNCLFCFNSSLALIRKFENCFSSASLLFLAILVGREISIVFSNLKLDWFSLQKFNLFRNPFHILQGKQYELNYP